MTCAQSQCQAASPEQDGFHQRVAPRSEWPDRSDQCGGQGAGCCGPRADWRRCAPHRRAPRLRPALSTSTEIAPDGLTRATPGRFRDVDNIHPSIGGQQVGNRLVASHLDACPSPPRPQVYRLWPDVGSLISDGGPTARPYHGLGPLDPGSSVPATWVATAGPGRRLVPDARPLSSSSNLHPAVCSSMLL